MMALAALGEQLGSCSFPAEGFPTGTNLRFCGHLPRRLWAVKGHGDRNVREGLS